MFRLNVLASHSDRQPPLLDAERSSCAMSFTPSTIRSSNLRLAGMQTRISCPGGHSAAASPEDRASDRSLSVITAGC